MSLFGYNPVIEAHPDNAPDQLTTILEGIEHYFSSLVSRNLETLKENTWIHRAELAKKILEAES